MSLQAYIEAAQTALFEKTGTFFAFSPSQFNEQKKEGVKYTSLDGGFIVPKENVKELIEGLDKIWEDGIKERLEKEGIEAIIKDELSNYECYYTGDLDNAIDVLEEYGATRKQIIAIYRQEYENNCDNL